MKCPCPGCVVVKLLAAIGAINWGLIAVANTDLVASLLGAGTTAARVAYGIIGVAGVLLLLSFLKLCPCQRSGSCAAK
jgi:uncharacterized membrane protein YuzA (DUF378 family)